MTKRPTSPKTNQPTFAKLSSPLGDLYLAFSNQPSAQHTITAVHGLYYAEQYAALDLHQNNLIHCETGSFWQQRINSYFLGSLNALGKALANSQVVFNTGTAFQHSVWLTLKDIPAGQLWTYKDVAVKIGRPKAARAVGGALAKNPLPLILPCHRVCRSDGSVGGYMGNSELGVARKRHLLWHEGLLQTDPQLLD